MSDEKLDYPKLRTTLAENRAILEVALPALTEVVTEMFGLLGDLLDENEELRDKVWSAERRTHAFDPWEAEDA